MRSLTFKALLSASACTVLVLAGATSAQAASVRVNDPGTDRGHGTDITQLAATNGARRVSISIRYHRGAHAKYMLEAVDPRTFVTPSVTIKRAADGTITAQFWILAPDSVATRHPCKGLTRSWHSDVRTVTVSFPQACVVQATGQRIPRRWYFVAFTGGTKTNDSVVTKPIVRG